jgi:mono/diheme cytochrome c family protein
MTNIRFNKSALIVIAAALTSVLVSCGKKDPLSPGVEYMPDMYRGPASEAYGESSFFSDGLASRKPVSGSIPRFNDETLPFYEPYLFPNTNEGYEAAGLSLNNPLPTTPEVLAKGESVYKIMCIHCHGEKGDGNGILVQRDKYAGVPSYYSAALKDLPVGKMYHTIYYGKNMMGSHASQINYAERWQVIKWVEKLRADGLGLSSNSDSTATTLSDTTKAATAGVKTAMK